MPRKKKKSKAKKNPKVVLSVDEKKAEKRRKLDAKLEAAKKRGGRIDFTKLKPGRKSERGFKIVRCASCGLPGELSAALKPSVLVVHRAKRYIGEDISVAHMTEFCVNSSHEMKGVF